jgi:hypothetical protein
MAKVSHAHVAENQGDGIAEIIEGEAVAEHTQEKKSDSIRSRTEQGSHYVPSPASSHDRELC